jgi:hypothetical protein
MKTMAVTMWVPVAALLAATAGGCGGSGGTGTGGSGGTSASTTTTATTTSGTGGSAGACLDAKAFASLFTIEDTSLCAVAMYDAAADLSYQQPSWGSHGGPLTILPDAATDGSVDLVRWKAPAGATGTMTSQVTTIAAKLPDLTSTMPAAYLSQPAIDLPFLGWTAFGYTGSDMADDNPGALVVAKQTALENSYPMNGLGSMVGVAGGSGTGRVLYTGLSPLGSTTPKQATALYGADLCGPTTMPGLASTTDATCMPVMVAAWGETTGPAALDGDGNLFVVMPTLTAGTQEGRAFPAASIAPGQPPTQGVTLFTLPGTGLPLAAIGPTATAEGIVALQPSDVNFNPEDVVAQHYTATGGTIQPMGTPSPLLKRASQMTSVILFTDDQSRLWAGVADSTSMTTTFVVIARTPG